MSDLTRRRADIVSEARRWTGTPYHHQASCLGAGVDCIGLVRGVWRTLYGDEPEQLPGYGRDWSEATGREALLEGARRHFVEVTPERARAGDVLVFRYRPRSVAKHVGILTSSGVLPVTALDAPSPTTGPDGWTVRPMFVHAIEGAPVAEVVLAGWWRRRVVAAFQFPGVVD